MFGRPFRHFGGRSFLSSISRRKFWSNRGSSGGNDHLQGPAQARVPAHSRQKQNRQACGEGPHIDLYLLLQGQGPRHMLNATPKTHAKKIHTRPNGRRCEGPHKGSTGREHARRGICRRDSPGSRDTCRIEPDTRDRRDSARASRRTNDRKTRRRDTQRREERRRPEPGRRYIPRTDTCHHITIISLAIEAHAGAGGPETKAEELALRPCVGARRI